MELNIIADKSIFAPMTYEEFDAIRSSIPDDPGVYRYYDAENNLLYVGKAISLRKRVSSYFVEKRYQASRIRLMVKKIERIEYTVVANEKDALLLENSFIKEQQPRYNVLLKDDKTYPWIVIKKEAFPRVFLTRQKLDDGSEYLGPFTSVAAVRQILQVLIQIFPLRNCTLNLSDKKIEEGKFKVCLEYHLGNCLAPCVGKQSREEYDLSVAQIRQVLKGRIGKVLQLWRDEMQTAADQLQFEQAAKLKQRIELLRNYEMRSAVAPPDLDGIDVYYLEMEGESAFISFMRIANGIVVQARKLQLQRKLDETPSELLQLAIEQFSLTAESLPTEIIIPFPPSGEIDGIKLTIPDRGDRKKLLELCKKNVMMSIQSKIIRDHASKLNAPALRVLNQLKTDLHLKEMPVYIECIDNSNIQGTNPVSALVVFKNAKASKSDYRHYKVETVKGPDDFATMQEVIRRRYSKIKDENLPMPQLLIVDGGKGQLSAVYLALKELGMHDKIAVIGIAKRLEEIYFPHDSLPLYINKKSESLKLIQRMRDEAHRFGIGFHRLLRSREMKNQSELYGLKGLGRKTADALMGRFKSISKIKNLDESELIELIGKRKAAILRAYFSAGADSTS